MTTTQELRVERDDTYDDGGDAAELDVVFRGYDREQVHDRLYDFRVALDEAEAARVRHLGEVAAARQELERVRGELTEAKAALTGQSPPRYADLGERVTKVLELAEEEAAALRASAREQAEALLDAAEAEAGERYAALEAAEAEQSERLAKESHDQERRLTREAADAEREAEANRSTAEREVARLRADAERAATQVRRDADAHATAVRQAAAEEVAALRAARDEVLRGLVVVGQSVEKTLQPYADALDEGALDEEAHGAELAAVGEDRADEADEPDAPVVDGPRTVVDLDEQRPDDGEQSRTRRGGSSRAPRLVFDATAG